MLPLRFALLAAVLVAFGGPRPASATLHIYPPYALSVTNMCAVPGGPCTIPVSFLPLPLDAYRLRQRRIAQF